MDRPMTFPHSSYLAVYPLSIPLPIPSPFLFYPFPHPSAYPLLISLSIAPFPSLFFLLRPFQYPSFTLCLSFIPFLYLTLPLSFSVYPFLPIPPATHKTNVYRTINPPPPPLPLLPGFPLVRIPRSGTDALVLSLSTRAAPPSPW